MAHARSASSTAGSGLAGDDRIANADDARRHDVGAQAAAMDHRPQQGTACQSLQVRAGLEQAASAAATRPQPDLLSYERMEVDAARDDVAASVGGRKFEALLAQRVQDL